MSKMAKTIAFIDSIWERLVPFFLVFFFVLVVSYGVLFLVDFVPEDPSEDSVTSFSEMIDVRDQSASALTALGNTDPYPSRIVIEKLGTDAPILNPASGAVNVLDAALLEGVVRHPESATFVNEGNMVLFGHSSYLPTVHNRNFQAFNGLEKLTRGDTIRVMSEGTEYVYRVQKVYETSVAATDIPLTNGRAELTLVTCNSFGSKDDRFVVEAMLVGEYER